MNEVVFEIKDKKEENNQEIFTIQCIVGNLLIKIPKGKYRMKIYIEEDKSLPSYEEFMLNRGVK